jgi:hypothetical protein
MDSSLSTTGGGMRPYLDRAEVRDATMAQLSKDLSLAPEELVAPPLGDGCFEQLRAQVLPVLEALHRQGAHALQVAMYRVDIPEAHLRRTMAAGGIDALAGECVLRALQKVLTRLRYAGRW